jgi:hypothetical protein
VATFAGNANVEASLAVKQLIVSGNADGDAFWYERKRKTFA